MGAPEADDCWSTYAVHMRFRPEAAVDGRYVIRFEDADVFSLAVQDGILDAIRGEIGEPTLVVEAEPTHFHALIEGRDDPERAVAEGRVRLAVGSETELRAFLGMFAPGEAQTAATAA